MHIFVGATILFSTSCLIIAYEEGKNIDRYYNERLGELKKVKISKLPPQIRKLLRFDKSIRESVLLAAVLIQINGIIASSIYVIFALFAIILSFVFSFSITSAGICLYAMLMIHILIRCTIIFVADSRYRKNMKPYKIRAKRCWKLELLKCVKIGYPSDCKAIVISSYVTDRGQILYRIKYGKYFVREFDAIADFGFKPMMDREVLASYWQDSPYFHIYGYAK